MKLIKKIIIGITAVLLSSCQSDLLDTNPWNAIGSGNMWASENLVDQGVIGVYNTLRLDRVALGVYKFDAFGVSADCREQDDDLLFNKATTGSGLFSSYWKEHYEGIHRANDAIAHIPGSPVGDAKKGRLVAEVKFLRAFFYYKLNMVYKGVPLYLEPIELEECIQGRETEAKIWETVVADLTDCIDEANLPDKYSKGDKDFGRITKSAAYALRGKVYLWTKEWAKAEADFRKVGELGHKLFEGGYKQLFKEANEQSDEMIFSLQHIGLSGYGNEISFKFGSRVTYGSCWNTYLASTDFVDSYEYADGRKFSWDDLFPGFSSLKTNQRAVYFLRDQMTTAEIEKMQKEQEIDVNLYLPNGNEARILQAYADRDPRLTASIITPYSQYNGANGATSYTYTLRWPYRGFDTADPFDVKTDTNNRFYYLFRKFVAEGSTEIPNRSYSPIDLPLIRYADVLLNLAEALNEQGKAVDDIIPFVNKVRERAGVAQLNTNVHTQVTGQDDLRERIRNERRWEFNGEGVNFFDELRWKTWHKSKFAEGSGLKQIWGQTQYSYTWAGEYIYNWPIPRKEIEMNSNLEQTDKWTD